MKRSIFLAMVLGFGLVSVAQGQEGRPVEERVRLGGRGSTAEPDSPAMTIVLTQENQTAEPRLVKFSGVLTDSMGRPLSGEVEVTFALYRQETDEEPLWKETQRLQLDKQGSYIALIGATQPDGVPVGLFRSDEARWLGAQIQGEPQRPRILLVSVPYALKAVEAEKLGGKSASDFVLSESLGEKVRQVIQTQGQVAAQPTLAGTATGKQSATNSTVNPQATSSGPMLPPTTFSGTTSNQVVLVRQSGSGSGLVATSVSSTGGSGLVGLATSTSTSSNQNGVFGQNAGAGAGVAGIATNTNAGVGVYGQSANFAGVFGNGTATSGYLNGVYGQSASTGGNGVSGNATATSGYANGVYGQSSAVFGAGVFGNALPTNGQASGVYGQSVNWVGVGGQATATSGGPAFGVWGDSLSSSGAGVAGYADSTSGFANGIIGETLSPDGNGVIAQNRASSGGNGIRGVADGTSGFANGTVGESSSPDGNGVIGQNRASNGGNGVRGTADGTSGFANGVVGESMSPSGSGIFGVNNASAGGYGVFGQTASPIGNGVFGHASAPTGGVGVVGFTEGPNAVAGQFVARGGSGLILQGLSGNGFNQVFSLDAYGNLNISGNLVVSGSKSAGVKLQNGREVALYAVESPENWFEDFGSGEMNNGVAWVPLDGSFAEATNATVTYHVFLTANGDSNGLYVSRKTPAGFEVREHGGSASNVAFDYRIVVRRRGYETIRMAEVYNDIKTSELSREHLAGLANSGNLKKIGAVKVPRIGPAPSIRPVPPRPNVPARPKPNVPQPPRPR